MDLTLRMGQHFADQLVKGREKGGGGWKRVREKQVQECYDNNFDAKKSLLLFEVVIFIVLIHAYIFVLLMP